MIIEYKDIGYTDPLYFNTYVHDTEVWLGGPGRSMATESFALLATAREVRSHVCNTICMDV